MVDPTESGLKAHFKAQLERKYAEISNFQGLVVDRSDWNSLYNYDFDDNASFINNRTAHLAQYSYIDNIAALREVMVAKQGAMKHNETVMLQNALGFSQLSLMKDFDGTFSEGAIVNAVGLLGARSTTILWTSNAKECCGSPAVADEFFQQRLYLKVFPMAPFPQADHCIGSDPKAEAYYLAYGQMMRSMVGAKWLLKAHAVNVTGGPARANAFEMPTAPGSATLWAVMLGGNQTTAELSVGYLPETELGVAEATKFEVLHPGASDGWTPLLFGGGGGGVGEAREAQLKVPLVQGCAMVRVAK